MVTFPTPLAEHFSDLHPVSVRRFPSFRTQPLEILATTYEKQRFLSNPAPGENLLSGNLVMETGCKGSICHVFTVCIRTENKSQTSFSPFGPPEISVRSSSGSLFGAELRSPRSARPRGARGATAAIRSSRNSFAEASRVFIFVVLYIFLFKVIIIIIIITIIAIASRRRRSSTLSTVVLNPQVCCREAIVFVVLISPALAMDCPCNLKLRLCIIILYCCIISSFALDMLNLYCTRS